VGILLTLRAKGVGGLAARAGTIAARFGPTAGPMERCLTRYADLMDEFAARPTLPVTACVLARHPALMRRFADRGVEWAIHGLVHNDHAALGLAEQRENLARAARLFEAAGVPYAGFRGPYLRYNKATDQAVRELGLRYHSSQAVAFAVLPREAAEATGYRRALRLYGALDAERVVVRPRARGGLVDIPVAMPDDEIMVDRLHCDDEAQAAAWLAVLGITHARGELFTVQLHPERIFDSAHALRATLREARQRRPGVWIARLDDIADWWLRRRRATLEVRQVAEGRYRVHLEGECDATLLVRGLPDLESEPWHGRDLVSRARSFEVQSAVKPAVGVSSRSPRAVHDFLREEGWPAEVSDDRGRFGAYLDVAGGEDGELGEAGLLAELERAAGPLVRLWRWPGGARSALSVTGDLDSITLQDFVWRQWETRRRPAAAAPRRLEKIGV